MKLAEGVAVMAGLCVYREKESEKNECAGLRVLRQMSDNDRGIMLD